MFEGAALTVLLAAAGGAVAGNLLSAFVKKIDKVVRRTGTKVDDASWETVRGAMEEVMDEFVDEKDAR